MLQSEGGARPGLFQFHGLICTGLRRHDSELLHGLDYCNRHGAAEDAGGSAVKYAGLESGYQCWCSTRAPGAAATAADNTSRCPSAPLSECGAPSTGNESETCGVNWRSHGSGDWRTCGFKCLVATIEDTRSSARHHPHGRTCDWARRSQPLRRSTQKTALSDICWLAATCPCSSAPGTPANRHKAPPPRLPSFHHTCQCEWRYRVTVGSGSPRPSCMRLTRRMLIQGLPGLGCTATCAECHADVGSGRVVDGTRRVGGGRRGRHGRGSAHAP